VQPPPPLTATSALALATSSCPTLPTAPSLSPSARVQTSPTPTPLTSPSAPLHLRSRQGMHSTLPPLPAPSVPQMRYPSSWVGGPSASSARLVPTRRPPGRQVCRLPLGCAPTAGWKHQLPAVPSWLLVLQRRKCQRLWQVSVGLL
jgi:hypothetical protein